ncbi:MAG: hypothetical protein JW395_0663 [Nitrospira sp.]|nr:hypothetical protein [Nitrospira sp.]
MDIILTEWRITGMSFPFSCVGSGHGPPNNVGRLGP